MAAEVMDLVTTERSCQIWPSVGLIANFGLKAAICFLR
jgi:hypothetical protein